MRVKLTLTALRENSEIPLDHQYAVASLIYAAIGAASNDFASKLHDVGFPAQGRHFKLFTFSRIKTFRARRVEDRLILEAPRIDLQVSSAVAAFVQHLTAGMSRQGALGIAEADFRLANIELIPPPVFTEQMSFRALSPITESFRDTPAHPRFLSLEDDWSAIVQRNLLRKYESLYGHQPDDQRLIWKWDRHYVEEAQKAGKRLSAFKDIRGVKVRGWLAPFTVEGSKPLIELGYEAGFGARNSMGFGMAELRKANLSG